MTEIYALKSYEAHEHLVSEAKRQLKLAYHYWFFTKYAYKFLVRKMVFEHELLDVHVAMPSNSW